VAVPVALMVDDPAPVVNVFWWHAAASQGTDEPRQGSGEPVAKYVPVDFLHEFARVVSRWGMKGKFSVLPYPAGLGKISEGWDGAALKEIEQWVTIVKGELTKWMDLTPEIHTHARALDLETMTLLDENERDWASHQTEATLTPYISAALRFLKEVGLEANGVTSPWNFGFEVEEDYRKAISRSLREVNGLDQAWYFLHVECDGTHFRSRLVQRDGDQWLVSIASQCGDHLWQTMEDQATGRDYVASVADHFLTEDGTSGRMAELFHAGTPIVFHTHWQSLYSNGRRTGLQALAEVGRRVKEAWGDDAEWVTCSELARRVADGSYQG